MEPPNGSEKQRSGEAPGNAGEAGERGRRPAKGAPVRSAASPDRRAGTTVSRPNAGRTRKTSGKSRRTGTRRAWASARRRDRGPFLAGQSRERRPDRRAEPVGGEERVDERLETRASSAASSSSASGNAAPSRQARTTRSRRARRGPGGAQRTAVVDREVRACSRRRPRPREGRGRPGARGGSRRRCAASAAARPQPADDPPHDTAHLQGDATRVRAGPRRTAQGRRGATASGRRAAATGAIAHTRHRRSTATRAVAAASIAHATPMPAAVTDAPPTIRCIQHAPATSKPRPSARQIAPRHRWRPATRWTSGRRRSRTTRYADAAPRRRRPPTTGPGPTARRLRRQRRAGRATRRPGRRSRPRRARPSSRRPASAPGRGAHPVDIALGRASAASASASPTPELRAGVHPPEVGGERAAAHRPASRTAVGDGAAAAQLRRHLLERRRERGRVAPVRSLPDRRSPTGPPAEHGAGHRQRERGCERERDDPGAARDPERRARRPPRARREPGVLQARTSHAARAGREPPAARVPEPAGPFAPGRPARRANQPGGDERAADAARAAVSMRTTRRRAAGHPGGARPGTGCGRDRPRSPPRSPPEQLPDRSARRAAGRARPTASMRRSPPARARDVDDGVDRGARAGRATAASGSPVAARSASVSRRASASAAPLAWTVESEPS